MYILFVQRIDGITLNTYNKKILYINNHIIISLFDCYSNKRQSNSEIFFESQVLGFKELSKIYNVSGYFPYYLIFYYSSNCFSLFLFIYLSIYMVIWRSDVFILERFIPLIYFLLHNYFNIDDNICISSSYQFCATSSRYSFRPNHVLFLGNFNKFPICCWNFQSVD